MFTISQIKEAHARVKSGADFPGYVKELKGLGLIGYDHYVRDGHTVYYGKSDFTLAGEAKYGPFDVSETPSKEKLEHALGIHQAGQTDYPTFCRQAAEAGVEKWKIDMKKMTCTYYDTKGHTLVKELIPEV